MLVVENVIEQLEARFKYKVPTKPEECEKFYLGKQYGYREVINYIYQMIDKATLEAKKKTK